VEFLENEVVVTTDTTALRTIDSLFVPLFFFMFQTAEEYCVVIFKAIDNKHETLSRWCPDLLNGTRTHLQRPLTGVRCIK
jgi:hypothetical protein